MSETQTTPARIPELDGLRGLAIFMVILCHYVGNAGGLSPGYWTRHIHGVFTVGWSGVDLFFVLSGFLIGGILLDARTSPGYFRAFYMRRVYRIVPIYYLWTILYGVLAILLLWLAPGKFGLRPKDLLQVPIHLVFVQNIWIGMAEFTWIWFVVTWSLAVEEQFYLLAPPVIRFCSKRNLVRILVATICFAPIFRVAVYGWTGNPFEAGFPMPGRSDELAWGILLAVFWREPGFKEFTEKRKVALRVTFLGLLAGTIALLPWLARPAGWVTLSIGLSWIALLYSCLLLLVISQKDLWIAGVMRWKVLGALGGISYCVYILHVTVNQFAHRLILNEPPNIDTISGACVTLLALGLTLAFASISWKYFEKPLIRRGHAYSYDATTAHEESVTLTEVSTLQR